MKRVLRVSLFAVPAILAAVLAAGCAPRERIIVIKEPATTTSSSGSTPIASGGAEGAGTGVASAAGERPNEDDAAWGIREPSAVREYQRVVQKVVQMVSDGDLQSRVARRNLSLVNVAWEDTGRSMGSAVGPNISDLSLQVRHAGENGGFQSAIMPVIRPPNFADRTGDVPADRFFVRVGNHGSRGDLRSVALTDVLKDLKSFAAAPDSILGSGNLLAPRDTHFLVSAQAVFLPIPKSGKAQFNPVLFNYQSSPGAPAVLSILVTRQGTSMQVIENRAEDATSAGWGQELYFDNKGQRAAFTAERKSDVEQRISAQGGPKTEDDRSALAKGADVLFLIQVPLLVPRTFRGGPVPMAPSAAPMAEAAGAAAPAKKAGAMDRDRSDVEQAVLGHGPNLGPFNEGHRLRLERDARFPIRVTVQFYKATSNGVVSDTDLDSISRSIGSVYEHAEFVGSLVLPENDARRPTAWQRVPREWFPW